MKESQLIRYVRSALAQYDSGTMNQAETVSQIQRIVRVFNEDHRYA